MTQRPDACTCRGHANWCQLCVQSGFAFGSVSRRMGWYPALEAPAMPLPDRAMIERFIGDPERCMPSERAHFEAMGYVPRPADPAGLARRVKAVNGALAASTTQQQQCDALNRAAPAGVTCAPSMLVPDRLSALLAELEQARERADALARDNQELQDTVQLGFVAAYRLQPDADTPGLYIQCESVAQRDAIMRTLRSEGDADQRNANEPEPVFDLTPLDAAQPEPPTHEPRGDQQCDHAVELARASFVDPAEPQPEPPTHAEPIPLQALSQRRQAIGLLTR